MTQAEGRLSRKILIELRKKQKCFAFKVHGSEYVMAGLPDIIGCVDGLFFAIETKLPETRHDVSPRQTWVHSLILRSGGAVTIACSVDEAQEFIRNLVRDRSKKAMGD